MARINYSPNLRRKARTLRGQGKSYKDICVELSVAKSTARAWTKDIVLSPEAKARLYTERVRKMTTGEFSATNRRLREIEKIILDAKQEISEPLNETAYKLLGAMVYWAEGNKNGQFIIVNSDPLLIKFMVEWMRQVFGAQYRDMKIRLNIYPQQDESKIKQFWSELTHIPSENFGKTFVKPANKNFKKNTLYYGTANVRLSKSANNLQRVFGWVRKFLENLEIDTSKVLTRWNTLRTEYGREPIGFTKLPK